MTPTLPELIDAAYPVLAPQERRVADLLRTRPELGLLATSSELARGRIDMVCVDRTADVPNQRAGDDAAGRGRARFISIEIFYR